MTILKHTNRGYSTLAADMNNSSDPVTFSVASGHGARFPSAFPFHVSIFNPSTPDTREILEITARTTDSMTGTRASEGTSKIAHTAGDAVWLNITSGLLDGLESEIAGKAPSSGIALTAMATQAAYTFLANLTSGAASPTVATAIQAFMLMMRACAAADHGNLGATHTFDLSTNWVHTGTVDQTVAITLTDPGVAGIVCRLILTATAGGEAISFVAGSNLNHTENWVNGDMPTVMPTGAGSRMLIFLQRTQDTDYYIGSYATLGAKT